MTETMLQTTPEFVMYTYFRSSASFRVRIAMKLKKLKYEYRAVHLLKDGGEQFKPAFGALNPSREVPTLVHGEKTISQSMAIMDYLDALHPSPRLFPEDPYERALVIQACEIINSGTQPFVNTRIQRYLKDELQISDEMKTKWVKDSLEHGSRTLEDFVKPLSGRYAIGDQITAADCFIFPHLVSSERFGGDFSDCPTLVRLKEIYLKDDAFVQAMPDKQPDAQ